MTSKPWSTDLIRGLALLAVGAVGALAAREAGIPAGMIVGALVAGGAFRLAGGDPGPWRGRYGRAGRLLLGTAIGAAVAPDVIAPLKAALLPMMALIAIVIGVALGLGWALGRFADLDPATALISSVPGGLPAMIAMSDDMGADAAVVTAIHFSRLTTILLIVPPLIRLLAAPPAGVIEPLALSEPVGVWRTAGALVVGLMGGLAAARTGVPTGDFVGSIGAVGAANLLGAGLGPADGGLRQMAMLLIGTAAGAEMSPESLGRLRRAAVSAARIVVTLITVGLVLGWGLSTVTPLDPVTALLSGVPGGASTMPAVAHELGGDMRLVAALHLTRQLAIFIVVPSVLSRLLQSRRCERLHSEG
ncbi:MAG: hypothetical protein MAG451_02563 [Anaerolineales bacterium]|nr:hypothetical protein [Anaerolineales bacterium]